MRFIKNFDRFLWAAFVCFFVAVLGFSFFIKPMYDFSDAPYFSWYTFLDVIVLCFGGLFITYVIKYCDFIEQKLSYKWMILAYLVCAVAFIVLVPLIPFSDMKYVWESALDFSNFQWDKIYASEYMQTFKGNIKLSVILGLCLIVLPKSLFSLKALNILFLLGIALCSAKTIEHLQWKYSKLTCCCILFFMPAFLYINHIYFDLLFLLIASLSLYLYTKSRNNIILPFLCLGFAYIFRVNAFLYVAAILIDFGIHMFQQKVALKRILMQFFISILVFFGIGMGGAKLIARTFYDSSIPSYPIWNQLYIGINENKFGFMDGDFDVNRSLSDVIDRMKEYGAMTMTEIYMKKNLWIWGEGTYQSSRYAFGLDSEDYREKYAYATPITPYVMSSEQDGRKFITAFCRIEYLSFAAMMLISVYQQRKNISTSRIFLLVFLCTIGILTFYEMKSRYILHCFPLMIMMALQYQSDSVKEVSDGTEQ